MPIITIYRDQLQVVRDCIQVYVPDATDQQGKMPPEEQLKLAREAYERGEGCTEWDQYLDLVESRDVCWHLVKDFDGFDGVGVIVLTQVEPAPTPEIDK